MEAAPFFTDLAEAPEGAAPRWLRSADGKRLRAVFWPDPAARARVLVLPGRTEYAEKYGRVVGRLRGLGLAVAILDWRGQGLSERFPPYPELGHIEDFRAYQSDLDALLAAPEVAEGSGPLLLLCHSMGGCVGLRALIERAEIAGAIFSAPMWGIRVGPLARMLVGPVAGTAARLGLGHRGMPGAARRAAVARAADNPLTSDTGAYLYAARQLAAHPELGLGPPSVHWTAAAFREMAALRRLPSPAKPMLGFLGSEETVVDPEAVRDRFAHAPDADLVVCPGGRHEILMECPEILARVWSRIATFP